MPTRTKQGYRNYSRGSDHPLAWGKKQRTIGEHRLVLYEKIGPGAHSCHWCGVRLIWAPTLLHLGTIQRLVVDHLDDDPTNNDPANLVPACSRCNTLRSNTSLHKRVRKPYVPVPLEDRDWEAPPLGGYPSPATTGPMRKVVEVLEPRRERAARGYVYWYRYRLECGHVATRRSNRNTSCACASCAGA